VIRPSRRFHARDLDEAIRFPKPAGVAVAKWHPGAYPSFVAYSFLALSEGASGVHRDSVLEAHLKIT
jgi:hypothetical protein